MNFIGATFYWVASQNQLTHSTMLQTIGCTDDSTLINGARAHTHNIEGVTTVMAMAEKTRFECRKSFHVFVMRRVVWSANLLLICRQR